MCPSNFFAVDCDPVVMESHLEIRLICGITVVNLAICRRCAADIEFDVVTAPTNCFSFRPLLSIASLTLTEPLMRPPGKHFSDSCTH
jgi:hypothetical protein